MTTETDVLVVGGGPAGLAAAVSLRRSGLSVVVADREPGFGGIARHADHTGYGIREFGRLMRGPRYARAWQARAERAGVELHPLTTVTGWESNDASTRRVTTTAPTGIGAIRARAVVLATGTRERPRAARLVPGDRPSGVLTTGALQQLVAGGVHRVGRRALVVGAEHVSFSAVLTLAHGGSHVVAVATAEPRHQSYAALRLISAGVRRVPVLTQTAVTRIIGSSRVEAVEITAIESGTTRLIECDTIVFTGDWVPDHELARCGNLEMDRGTRAPRVDNGLRTPTPGVFATGNLLHGAETAAVCARSGAWVARSVRAWLEGDGDDWPAARSVPIVCAEPLRWISPNAIVPGVTEVPHGHFLARSSTFARPLRLFVRQGDRELWSGSARRAVPTMPIHLPAPWLARVAPEEPVHITVAG